VGHFFDVVMFRTLFPFTAEEAGELSVGPGDLLRLDEDDSDSTDGWVKVKNGMGKAGFVPRDYVEFLPAHQAQAHAQALPKHSPAESQGSYVDSPADSLAGSPDVIDLGDGAYQAAADIAADVSVAGYGNWLLPAGASALASPPRAGTPDTSSSLESGSFSPSSEPGAGMTLYDLAADPSTFSPSPQARRDVFRTDSVPSARRDPARVFSANNFVRMTGSSSAAAAAATLSSPSPARGAPRRPLGASTKPGLEESFSLPGAEPALSSAAARGDLDELLLRLQAHFDALAGQAAAESAALLAAADSLGGQLQQADQAHDGLLESVLQLSDALEAGRAAQQARSAALRHSQTLDAPPAEAD